MKHIKKFMCLILAVALVFGMGITVFAAEEGAGAEGKQMTYRITAPAVEGGYHYTYVVYQIFTGDDLEGDGSEDILSNIVWGQNGSGTVGESVDQDTLKKLEAAADKSDQEILNIIKTDCLNADSTPFTIITSGNSVEVPAGYYLIKDEDNSVNGDDAYTTYIMQVVGDVVIKRKSGKPVVDKEVENDKNVFDETADHAIGETFRFKLTATVPAETDLAAYETYQLVFHDTMSAGVTFEKIDSVTVKIGEKDKSVDSYSCTAVEEQAGGEWTLIIDDLKGIVGDDWGNVEITVEVLYSAHLNAEAVISKGNETNAAVNNNKVALEYSNNPNVNGTGLGKTKEDTVFVFTYESDYTKIDGNNKEGLKGVTFKLYKDEEKTEVVKLFFDKDKNAYRPVIGDEEPVEEMTSGIGGQFNIIGLDAGIYYLEEVKGLDGYNKIEELVKITITAEHSENQSGAGADLTLTIPKTKDKDSLEIENFGGTTLPRTGGSGTTIFYVLGSILVLGCGVILVVRKRINK
ncbi:MAG: isopeptide-forming domain-containing fimbrial protein [Lachnospiraceae bacterium]|nr:isopeptide-forming domain-containing fimbrial protein [Lachnospiraceae bacterium]